MRAPHVDAQREQLVNLNSELQNLVNEREKWESSYPGLSEDREKLEKVRTTPQTNDMLKLINIAHTNVVAKIAEVNKVEQEFASTQLKLAEVDSTHKEQNARRNAHVEQVLQMSQRHFHNHMSSVQRCKPGKALCCLPSI